MSVNLGRDSVAALRSSPMLKKLYNAREESPDSLHDVAVAAALNNSTRRDLVESIKNLPHACNFCVISYRHYEIAKNISEALSREPSKTTDAADLNKPSANSPPEILQISNIKTEISEIKSLEHDITSVIKPEEPEVIMPLVISGEQIETNDKSDHEILEEIEVPELRKHLVEAVRPRQMEKEEVEKEKEHVDLVENLMALHASILDTIKSLSEDQLKHYMEGVFTHQRPSKLESEQLDLLHNELKDKLNLFKEAFKNGAEDLNFQVEEIVNLKSMLSRKSTGKVDAAFKDISARLDECLEEIKTIKQSLEKRNEELSRAKDLLLTKRKQCCDAPEDELHLHGHLNGFPITLKLLTDEESFKGVKKMDVERKQTDLKATPTSALEDSYIPNVSYWGIPDYCGEGSCIPRVEYWGLPEYCEPPEYSKEHIAKYISEDIDKISLYDTVEVLYTEASTEEQKDEEAKLKEISKEIIGIQLEKLEELTETQVKKVDEVEMQLKPSEEQTHSETAKVISVEESVEETKPVDAGKLPQYVQHVTEKHLAEELTPSHSLYVLSDVELPKQTETISEVKEISINMLSAEEDKEKIPKEDTKETLMKKKPTTNTDFLMSKTGDDDILKTEEQHVVVEEKPDRDISEVEVLGEVKGHREETDVDGEIKAMKPKDETEAREKEMEYTEIKSSVEDANGKVETREEIDTGMMISGVSSIGIPYYPSQSTLPPAIIELIHDSLKARKSIDKIEKDLNDLELEFLIKSSPPASCARASVINEVQDPVLPYSPSLKSLPLCQEDIPDIQERAEKYNDFVRDHNNQWQTLRPAYVCADKAENQTYMPWTIPDYIVVSAVHHDKPWNLNQDNSLDSLYITLDDSQQFSNCLGCTHSNASCCFTNTSLSEKSAFSQNTTDSSDFYERILQTMPAYSNTTTDDVEMHFSRKNWNEQRGNSTRKQILLKCKDINKNLESPSLVKECNSEKVHKSRIYENDFTDSAEKSYTRHQSITKEAQLENVSLQEPKILCETEHMIPNISQTSHPSWALIKLSTLSNGTKSIEVLETSENPPGDFYVSDKSPEF